MQTYEWLLLGWMCTNFASVFDVAIRAVKSGVTAYAFFRYMDSGQILGFIAEYRLVFASHNSCALHTEALRIRALATTGPCADQAAETILVITKGAMVHEPALI
jgi:hypothetical protein